MPLSCILPGTLWPIVTSLFPCFPAADGPVFSPNPRTGTPLLFSPLTCTGHLSPSVAVLFHPGPRLSRFLSPCHPLALLSTAFPAFASTPLLTLRHHSHGRAQVLAMPEPPLRERAGERFLSLSCPFPASTSPLPLPFAPLSLKPSPSLAHAISHVLAHPRCPPTAGHATQGCEPRRTMDCRASGEAPSIVSSRRGAGRGLAPGRAPHIPVHPWTDGDHLLMCNSAPNEGTKIEPVCQGDAWRLL